MTRIDKASGWGREWQKQGNWTPHTLTGELARSLVPGYLKFLRVMCGGLPAGGAGKGLDIGAGAGYVAAALAEQSGLQMTASEWNVDGINLIHR